MNRIEMTEANRLPLVLTPTDIAAVLGISRNTVYEVIHRKDFPAFKVGKQYRISRERFINWMNGQAA
ncbi:MAG: helix-turn-helix domain-containing protein [Candidatus Pararuminococcus gallinarum]|jgi:excisionase family DNA binding protein